MQVKNKTVVITGASGGFGKEFVLSFAKMGANVEALDFDGDALKKLKSQMQDVGYKIHTHRCDVTQPDDFSKYAENLQQRKKAPVIWINNAGIAFPNSFKKMSQDMFEKIMAVNFWGVVHGSRTALALMAEQHEGVIVNIASASGVLPAPFLSAYTASKHAVVGFTRSLQMELALAKSTLTLSLVLPGFAKTAINNTNPDIQIPEWLKLPPKSMCQKIVTGILAHKKEIYPDLSVKMLRGLYSMFPQSLTMLSHFFAAKNLREFFGIENIER